MKYLIIILLFVANVSFAGNRKIDAGFIEFLGISSPSDSAGAVTPSSGYAWNYYNSTYGIPYISKSDGAQYQYVMGYGDQTLDGTKTFNNIPLHKLGISLEDPGAGTGVVTLKATASSGTYTVTMPAGACAINESWIGDGLGGFVCGTADGGSGGTVYAWSGYHDSDCGAVWATASASFGDFPVDSSCTFTEVSNTNFGTVTSAFLTSNGNNWPGIRFTVPTTGIYLIVASFNYRLSTVSESYALEFYDGSTSFGQIGFTSVGSSTNHDSVMSLTGVYSGTGSSTVNLRIRGRQSDAHNITIGTSFEKSIQWAIFKIN